MVLPLSISVTMSMVSLAFRKTQILLLLFSLCGWVKNALSTVDNSSSQGKSVPLPPFIWLPNLPHWDEECRLHTWALSWPHFYQKKSWPHVQLLNGLDHSNINRHLTILNLIDGPFIFIYNQWLGSSIVRETHSTIVPHPILILFHIKRNQEKLKNAEETWQ